MRIIYAVLSLSEVFVYFIYSDGEFKFFLIPFFYQVNLLNSIHDTFEQ